MQGVMSRWAGVPGGNCLDGPFGPFEIWMPSHWILYAEMNCRTCPCATNLSIDMSDCRCARAISRLSEMAAMSSEDFDISVLVALNPATIFSLEVFLPSILTINVLPNPLPDTTRHLKHTLTSESVEAIKITIDCLNPEEQLDLGKFSVLRALEIFGHSRD